MIRKLRASHNPLKQIQNPSPTLLSLLTKGTEGDVSLAENELRWLQEHVDQLHPTKPKEARVEELWKLCRRRARLEPLQLILGSQPFGDLEIKCRKGVLIPRPETEAYTIHLARLLNSGTLSEILRKQFTRPTGEFKVETKTVDPLQGKCPDQDMISTERLKTSHATDESSSQAHESNSATVPSETVSQKDNSVVPTLNILDICSGSGCISLLLHSLLSAKFPRLKITGWDISKTALALSHENLQYNIANGSLPTQATNQISFQRLDIFNPPSSTLKDLSDIDIIISNPPYISAQKLLSETTQSVREWEPRLALVPSLKLHLKHDANWPSYRYRPEDVFYAQLLYLYGKRRRCRVLVMEIGDREQAIRVVKMALKHVPIARDNRIEIWRDWPDQEGEGGEESSVDIWGEKIKVVGEGSMRSVVLVLERMGEAVVGDSMVGRGNGGLGKARGRRRSDVLDPIQRGNTGNKIDPVKQLIDRKMRTPKRRMV